MRVICRDGYTALQTQSAITGDLVWYAKTAAGNWLDGAHTSVDDLLDAVNAHADALRTPELAAC